MPYLCRILGYISGYIPCPVLRHVQISLKRKSYSITLVNVIDHWCIIPTPNDLALKSIKGVRTLVERLRGMGMVLKIISAFIGISIQFYIGALLLQAWCRIRRKRRPKQTPEEIRLQGIADSYLSLFDDRPRRWVKVNQIKKVVMTK